jgi:hypothetical protein
MMILKHLRPKQNSFYLVGDGDEIDLVETIESAFDLEFDYSELETTLNMGQLFDLIVKKVGERDGQIERERIWTDLTDILVHHSGHTGGVDRNTTFIATWV